MLLMLGRRLASPHARRQGFASRAAASPRSVVRLAAHAQMYRRLRDSLSVAGRSILLALLLEAKLVDPTDHGTARGSALHCAFTISLRLALESLSCHLTPWLDISIALRDSFSAVGAFSPAVIAVNRTLLQSPAVRPLPLPSTPRRPLLRIPAVRPLHICTPRRLGAATHRGRRSTLKSCRQRHVVTWRVATGAGNRGTLVDGCGSGVRASCLMTHVRAWPWEAPDV